jgi:hypothetical protein
MTSYKNHEIDPDPFWGFVFTHIEYTGPEDYCGAGKSIEDCKQQIDERILDNLELLNND